MKYSSEQLAPERNSVVSLRHPSLSESVSHDFLKWKLLEKATEKVGASAHYIIPNSLEPLHLCTSVGEATMEMVVLGVVVVMSCVVVMGAHAASSRPDPNDAHKMARWLVSSNSWAVISTTSLHLKGAPWGNVADFSDGTSTNFTGVPYFYLTMLDPTPQDLAANSKCSVTISEAPLGTCGDIGAEDPRCAKLTLYGEMKLLQSNTSEFSFGREALFSKHPQMKDWPTAHNFKVYKLLIEDIFLIDYFGGPKQLSVADYFKDV